MKRIFERRVRELEARCRKPVAVIKQLHPDELNDDALARHLAAHPEDHYAELTVFLEVFTEEDCA
jgi:hypothetical protein